MKEESITGPRNNSPNLKSQGMAVDHCLAGPPVFDSPSRTFTLLRLLGFNYALGTTGQPLSEHKYINTWVKLEKQAHSWTERHNKVLFLSELPWMAH